MTDSPSQSRPPSATPESDPSQLGPKVKCVYELIHPDLKGLENYCPGGFHPIDIDGLAHDGRYKMVHKPGHWAYSSVRLARDQQQQRYVSIKFVLAWASEESSEGQIIFHLQNASTSIFVHPG